jgi:hypothetical protein
MRRHLFHFTAVLGIGLGLVSETGAQALVREVHKDFGSIARGTILTHQFHLTNPTSSLLHIAGLRTSCACATAMAPQTEVAPGEATEIIVTVDTNKFSGPRNFSIYVQIDRPFVDELRLSIQANSREDVTLTPGQLAFGRIKQGSGPRSSILVEHFGAPDWRITGIDNDNAYLKTELLEVGRNHSRVSYQINVKLREDIPTGAWHADLWLKTTDPSLARIPLMMTVEVEAALTVTPNELSLGRLRRGSRVERKVVLRGGVPFKVTRVEGSDDRVRVDSLPQDSRAVQTLTVRVTGLELGPLNRKLRMVTDLADAGVAEVVVQAQIVP